MRITFSPQTSYELALTQRSELGFRLGNPCYEKLLQGAQVRWLPMGQESAYATMHSLLVITTRFNSIQRQQQVQSSLGVTQIQVAPSMQCANQ